jgi:alpha-galactosidase
MSDSRLVVLHEDVAGDTKKNLSSAGSELKVGEEIFDKGLGVSPNTTLRVELTKPAVAFKAEIGVDQFCDSIPSSVRFRVEAGGKDLFVSDPIRASQGRRLIDIPLGGIQAFNLTVEAAPGSRGGGRSDWINGRVLFQDGSQLPLDELADAWGIDTDIPFSFTMDGQPSRVFLNSWKRDVHVEQLDSSRIRRTITLQDPNTGVEVQAVATVYTDTSGVDWTLYIANHGSRDTPVIEKLNALDVAIRPGIGTPPVLQRLHGSYARFDDWQPYDATLKPGERIESGPTTGRSSSVDCPYFTLQYGGGGVITAVGWSGEWQAETEWQRDGKLRLQAGMKNLHLSLHPGESIRSPRILQMYWFGSDREGAFNLFRETMLSHIMPKIDGEVVRPPIVHMSTSFYEMNESTQDNVMSHLDSIKDLGFEMFWLDAYWTKDGFPEGMGNYGFPINRVEPADRFPHGLRPIGDAVHRDRMKFLVWFEPERVFRGTYLAKEHPEWVVTLEGTGNALYNLGVPEAREYMTKYLVEAIKAYGIDCLRIDFNFDPAPYWKRLDTKTPSRTGLAEIRYVEGLYKMWDDILKTYPNLFIDDCAGGGQRIDLETSSRSVPLWRTDGTIEPLLDLDYNQAALQNQVMTAGLSRYVPYSTSGEMGATPYLFRSGFNAGISFAEDVRSTTYPRELLRQGISEGKRLRKYFAGHFHTLGEVTTSPEDWCVLQYHRAAEQDGIVLAFRRHKSPYESFRTALREISSDGNYRVSLYHGYDADKTVTMTGAELQNIRLDIADSPGSLLIEYKRIGP